MFKKSAVKKPSPCVKARKTEYRIKTFVQAYLVNMNGTEAAIKAGYSKHSAYVTGSQLLKNPKVQEELNRVRKERADRLELTVDFVVSEAMKIAKVDMADLFYDDGSVKPISEIPEDVRHAISGVDVDEIFENTCDTGKGIRKKQVVGQAKRIRMHDKIRALALLGNHLGMYKQPTEGSEGSEKTKKMDLLQVIKLISKDGQTAIVENRITGGAGKSGTVDTSCARGYEVL